MGVPHFDGVRVDGSACYLAVQSQMFAFSGRSEPFTEFERGCGGNNFSVRQLRPFISFATGIVDIILDDGLFVFANALGRSLFLPFGRDAFQCHLVARYGHLYLSGADFTFIAGLINDFNSFGILYFLLKVLCGGCRNGQQTEHQ